LICIEFGPQKETHFGNAYLWVVDEENTKWIFHRTAIQNWDGTFDMEQLNDFEVMLDPGIIYRPENYETLQTNQNQLLQN
jgi:hypothetical protein